MRLNLRMKAYGQAYSEKYRTIHAQTFLMSQILDTYKNPLKNHFLSIELDLLLENQTQDYLSLWTSPVHSHKLIILGNSVYCSTVQ